LDAGGENGTERADREEVPLRPEVSAMKQKPQQRTAQHGGNGGAHLRPKQLFRIIAARSRQCECRAGPKHAGQNMQDEGKNERDLHAQALYALPIEYTFCISNYGIRVT
jgi:hypothetical protein